MRRMLAEGIVTPEDHLYDEENPYADIYMRIQNKMVDQTQPSGIDYDDKNGGKPSLIFRFPKGIIGVMKEEEADLHPSQHIRDLAARPVIYAIKNADRERGIVYLSRKKAREIIAEKTWELLRLGLRIKGVVVGIAKNGIILDIGGINAYLHKSQIGWTPIRVPLNQLFKKGDVLDVAVIKFRKPGETEFVEKQPRNKPYYMQPIDDEAAIKVDTGTETTDDEYEETADNEPDNLAAGQPAPTAAVEATADKQESPGRVWVSVKELIPDPWLDPGFLYKEGGEYTGTVRKIAEQGVFVELKDGTEIKVIHAKKHPPVGSTVLVRVLKLDFENRRMKGRFVRVLD